MEAQYLVTNPLYVRYAFKTNNMRLFIFMLAAAVWAAFGLNDSKGISIHEAVKQQFINLKATSTGEMNGTSIRLETNLLKGNQLKVLIPAGTLFKTELPGDQDMLVAEPQEILVKRGQSFYPVRGYCCQSSNAVPEEKSGFELAVHPNRDVQQMLAYTQNIPFSKQVMQEAIWAVCDKESPYAVSEPGNAAVEQLRNKICEITGVEIPVYEQQRTLRVVDRQPVAEPVLVRANVSYEVKRRGKYLTMVIEDGAGYEVSRQKANSPINQTGTYRINFKLKVAGWEQGDYVLKLKLDDELVKSMPFKV